MRLILNFVVISPLKSRQNYKIKTFRHKRLRHFFKIEEKKIPPEFLRFRWKYLGFDIQVLGASPYLALLAAATGVFAGGAGG
jgi:hypothetical protein